METVENNRVVLIASGCQYEAHRLYSLWDMISFLADELVRPLDALKGHEMALLGQGQDGRVTKEQADMILSHLDALGRLSTKLGLSATHNRVNFLIGKVIGGGGRSSLIAVSLDELSKAVRLEVYKIQFAHIPANKLEFFEQHDLFGELVSSAFPSAQIEIKDAGNCLAADLHTAAVFHLMRAVESGMRALAIRLRVKTKDPLEYSDWGQIIPAIRAKVNLLPSGRSPKKDKALAFYNRTVSDCEDFRVSRNRVSHNRAAFNEKEALGLCERVRDFMQRLTENGIRESN
jgi:hypothetical protein